MPFAMPYALIQQLDPDQTDASTWMLDSPDSRAVRGRRLCKPPSLWYSVTA